MEKRLVYLVPFGVFVSEYLRIVSLRVVIVDENERILRWQKAPFLSPIHQPFQIIVPPKRIGNLIRIFELDHRRHFVVLPFRDRLVPVIDHLLEYVRPCILGEAVGRVQVPRSRVNCSQVVRPHVFRSIHSETG